MPARPLVNREDDVASRQREWQKRMKSEGRCIVCGKPLHNANYCLEHAIAKRERARKYHGSRKRYTGCESYRTEDN